MDLVYIVKESDFNPELKFSLRSVERFLLDKIDNIFIIGYKPKFIKNVEYLSVPQFKTKWKNSTENVTRACLDKRISENFILMNDDFFCTKSFNSWKDELNVCMGEIHNRINYINKNVKKPTVWHKGFFYARDLLTELNVKNEFDYEIHAPIIINKEEFTEFINIPLIKRFCEGNHVLLKRTLYRNIYDSNNPRIEKDFKIKLNSDLELPYERTWISVYDNVIGIKKYKNLNSYLERNFGEKSSFEV